MDAVIYTKSIPEYEMLSGILADELPGITVSQGVMDEHYHLEQGYDVVVVSVDGAQGMELVFEYRRRFSGMLVVWITDDPYFAGVAIRTHIFDFIVRPYTEMRFRESVKNMEEEKEDMWRKISCSKWRDYYWEENVPGESSVCLYKI